MKKVNLRWRVIFQYVALAIIPAACIFGFYTHSYIMTLEEDMSISVLQTLKQAALNISNDFETVRHVSDSLVVNTDVQEALGSDPASQSMGEKIEEINKLRTIIDNLQRNSRIAGIRLFVDDDKLYASEKINFFPISEFAVDPHFMNVSGRGEFFETTVLTVADTQPRSSISFVRQIRSVSSIGKVIGALCIDINLQTILDILSAIDFPNDWKVSFVDARYSPSIDTSRLDKAGEAIYMNGDTVYATKAINVTNWYLMAELPNNSVRANVLRNRAGFMAMLLFSLAVIAAFFAVSVWIVGGVAKRVDRLSDVLGGELETYPGSPSRGRSLFGSLDKSLGSANSLIKTLYEQIETQKRTQLQMLQEQINPHFIYNTLETLQWMVRVEKTENALAVISWLARYLRLILNNGRDIVTVDEEISLVEAYIHIYRQRYGEAFDIEIIAEPDAKLCLLPKMTLQPIIENSILHGLEELRGRRGRVDVDIYTSEEALVLSVTDNGVGMDTDRADELISTQRSGSNNFGLYNVNQRIILFSGGQDYGLTVESEEGKYTTVTVYAAIKRGDEIDEQF